jgi:hypothetical protein
MCQHTSRNPHQMPTQTASARSLDSKDRRQGAETPSPPDGAANPICAAPQPAIGFFGCPCAMAATKSVSCATSALPSRRHCKSCRLSASDRVGPRPVPPSLAGLARCLAPPSSHQSPDCRSPWYADASQRTCPSCWSPPQNGLYRPHSDSLRRGCSKLSIITASPGTLQQQRWYPSLGF